MTTSTVIINNALRRLGMIESGASGSVSELDDGLESLNDMIQSWSSVEGLRYEADREDFPITSLVKKYTIGAMGDFNTSRPRKILNATIFRNDITYRLRLITYREIDWIANSNVVALPSRLYYRKEYPLGTLEFDYMPDQDYTLRITSIKELPEFPDLTTDISYPGEYIRALKAALAVEIAPEYGIEPSAGLVSAGRAAMESIVTQSTKIQPLRTPPGLTKSSRYNIYADE